MYVLNKVAVLLTCSRAASISHTLDMENNTLGMENNTLGMDNKA